MKTSTRTELLKIIEKNGKIRPVELRKILNISAQALHRHLRALTQQGLIEVKGSVSFPEYACAGVPDFQAASRLIKAPTQPHSPESRLCETREVFTPRLSH